MLRWCVCVRYSTLQLPVGKYIDELAKLDSIHKEDLECVLVKLRETFEHFVSRDPGSDHSLFRACLEQAYKTQHQTYGRAFKEACRTDLDKSKKS
jgi:hypothetical protein